jgi:SNF2 family DNA or RNA helicase
MLSHAGLDFSAASMVVFVELPAEVALVRQAEDRAHRKGQAAKAVNVYFLCAQGTVDDKQWQALNTSLAHISQVCVARGGGQYTGTQ